MKKVKKERSNYFLYAKALLWFLEREAKRRKKEITTILLESGKFNSLITAGTFIRRVEERSKRRRGINFYQLDEISCCFGYNPHVVLAEFLNSEKNKEKRKQNSVCLYSPENIKKGTDFDDASLQM